MNMKETWNILNTVIHKKEKGSQYPTQFNEDARKVTGNIDIANGFNRFFSNIGPALTPKTTSFRHMKLHVKSQIVMYVNGRPSLHINLRIVFIYCTKQLNHHLYIPFIVIYKQLNIVPIYTV